MTISDLLTLIGIILAIIAFISEKNREYIFLKLSRFDIITISIMFVYVHFLLSYPWWRNKIEYLKYFEIPDFPNPTVWAYFFSLFILGFSVNRIFFGQFPKSRKTELIRYYKKLIIRSEFSFLSQLIEKYHIVQVVYYLNQKKDIRINNPTGISFYDDQEYDKIYNRLTKKKKFLYGANVHNYIILNDTFLENVANINPYLFASIIRELDNIALKESDFVNRFLKILTLNKNSLFFKEIRKTANLRQDNSYIIYEENFITYSLFNEVNVCSINEAWRGVGEQALTEMYEEAKKVYSPLRESDQEQENDTLWSYKIKMAISYFDIMVRQAISQGIQDHMWMFYYAFFIESIILNMPELPSVDSDYNRMSRNFKLIQEIIENQMDWKTVAIKSKNKYLKSSIYNCLGQCIYKIAITEKLRSEDKNYLVNWVWEDLIRSSGRDDEENKIVTEFIEAGFEMFKRPTPLFPSKQRQQSDESNKYISCLIELWQKRDRAILTGVMGQRANDFHSQVLNQFTYNPD